MEYVSILNHILVEDREGQEHHLQLTTWVWLPCMYDHQCVTILNEKTGLIEWVRNTEPVLRKLDSIRHIQGLRSCNAMCVEMKSDYSSEASAPWNTAGTGGSSSSATAGYLPLEHISAK